MSGQEIRAGRAFVEVGARDRTDKVFREIQKRLRSLASTAGRIGIGLQGLGASMAAPFLASIPAASNMQETLNKFNATFGVNADAVRKWSDDFSESIGRSKMETMDSLAAFQAFFVGMGFANDQASEMSKTIRGLSVDFASFHNLSDEESMQRFISALSGSGEVLDRFGVNIKVAALDIKLLEMGLPKVSKGATEAQKALARMQIIMESMGSQGAIGDALNTAGSYANMMKRLNAEFENTKVAMGTAILPLVTKLLVVTAPIIKSIAKWIGLNQSLSASLFLAAAGVFVLGSAFVALSTGLFLAAIAIKVAAVLISPAGLFGIAVAGIVASLVGLAAHLGILQEAFRFFAREASIAFGGIAEMLRSGDTAGAMKVLTLSLHIIWAEGVFNLMEVWRGFKLWILDSTASMSVAMINLVANMIDGLLSVFAPWVDVVADLQTDLKSLRESAVSAVGAVRDAGGGLIAAESRKGRMEIAALRAERNELIASAKRHISPSSAPGAPKLPEIANAAIATTARVVGTFSPSALARMAGNPTQDRQLKEQEKTNDHLDAIELLLRHNKFYATI